MATNVEYDERGAYLLYSLFHKYATYASAGTSYSTACVSYTRMKELMLDMDILEGVPPALMEVFVREHMQRANQEGGGVIGVQDFMVWLLTEVAALLPIRDAFCRVTGLRPLYNQFHAVLLGDVGFTDGARRTALGMAAVQFSRLAEEYGLSCSSEGVRYAFKAARASVGAFRASSGANTGAQGSEPAGGGRLQFAAFVRALAMLATQRMGSLDAALYQVVSCGVPAKLTDPRVTKPPLPPGELISLGLSSRLEGSCTKESYMCDNCGQEHQRWRLDNWLRLEEVLISVGIPHPVRRFLPALPLVTTRNLRAAFHRYNAMYNKGKLPPASYRLPGESTSQSGAGGDGEGLKGFGKTGEGSGDGYAGGGGGSSGGCCSQPAAYGACCCLFRSLSVMEMSSWLRLCGDCDAIREMIQTHGSGVTPATLESVFVQAASIAGVYLPDESAGIHDVPIASGDGGAKLGLPRNSLGAVVGSEARAAPEHPPPKRSTAAYQAPYDGHSMAAATAAGGSIGGNAPRLHEVQGPNSAATWLASARSVPYGSGGSGAATASAARGQQHRPSRLVLTFPQFLEALRLVAEEAGGHPTRTTATERELLRIVHDIVREGCPRPDPTTATGVAQLRRQQLRRAVTVGGSVSLTSSHQQLSTEVAANPSPPPPPVATTAARSFSGTSTTTSTKYTYDDFTPPESDLYTSATSSRITSRPASASGGRNTGNGADGARPANQDSDPPMISAGTSSTSTSTKYTYDDFTPPESSLYTSASSSSKVGSSRGASQTHTLSSQSWRPEPVKAFSNTKVDAVVDVKSLPSQLQPKRRSRVVAVAAAVQPPATVASNAPRNASAWIMTMPPPPSARIRPMNTLPMTGSVGLISGGSGGGGGGGGGGASASLAPRACPASASRVRRQSVAISFGDRAEYIPYGAAVHGSSGGGVAVGDDRPASRSRPGSAKHSRPGFGGTEPGSSAAATYPAAAAAPPFSQQARPAWASAQRSQPQTAGEGGSRPRSQSPPPPRPPPPQLSYPAAAAVVTSASTRIATGRDLLGVSGQLRSSSPSKARPASANAALGRTAVPPAAAQRQTVGGRSGAASATANGSPAAGVAKPFSRGPNTAPGGAAATAGTAVAAGAAAGPRGGNRAPSGRPASQSNTSGDGAGGSSSRRTPSGMGFVSPLLPAPTGDGTASDTWFTPRQRPPLSAAAVAVAASFKAEAAAAAALAAAAAARYGTLGRLPPPNSGSSDYPFVTVHPNTPAEVKRTKGKEAGAVRVGSGEVPTQSQSPAPSLAPPVLLSVPPSAGSGLRNLLLLQSVNTASGSSGTGSPLARSSSETGRMSTLLAAGTTIQRANSATHIGVAAMAGPPPPAASSQLEHVMLPYEAPSLPIKGTHRSASMGEGGGGSTTAAEADEDGEEMAGARHCSGLHMAVAAAADARDDLSSGGVTGEADAESMIEAPSPRTVLAATKTAKSITVVEGRTRLPAEGTVHGLPQYYFR